MRKRQMKWLWKRLRQLAAMEVSREEMLMKLGAARSKAPSAWRLVNIAMDKDTANFTYSLNRDKLGTLRRREGRYLLRTNIAEGDPALLWQYYIQLVAVEEAFKTLKDDLRLTRYTQPEPELQLLLKQMKLVLPPQPPPKISGTAVANPSPQ